MFPAQFSHFERIISLDFEFNGAEGEEPNPVCLTGKDIISGDVITYFGEELQGLKESPFPNDDKTLYLAFYSSAEWKCFKALKWPLPKWVCDLFAEFRVLTNGKHTYKNSLLSALAYFGIDAMLAAEKKEIIDLILRGGPWREQEREIITKYNIEDVVATERLFWAMSKRIDLPRALLRGEYMKAISDVEYRGIPIDGKSYQKLLANWDQIKMDLIEEVDRDFGVYEGMRFKQNKFVEYLQRHRIIWPLTEKNNLKLDDETFKEMSTRYPALNPLRELRAALSQLKLNDLQIGSDSRNRFMVSCFSSKTGRNQPSTTKSIFGPAVFIRNLIKPKPGFSIAYIDWSQQETGIGAALSGDESMMQSYCSDDCYLDLAKKIGYAPPYATRETHPEARELFKTVTLAVQYGMGEQSLALKIDRHVSEAREIIRQHKKTYSRYWEWQQEVLDKAALLGYLETVFGWRYYTRADDRIPSLKNLPMQSHGAEMMRLAVIFTVQSKIKVCATVHDALLIEAPSEEIDSAVAQTQKLMADASSLVLNGFELKSKAEKFHYPDNYRDSRGDKMWELIWRMPVMGAGHLRPEVPQVEAPPCSIIEHPVHIISLSLNQTKETYHEV